MKIFIIAVCICFMAFFHIENVHGQYFSYLTTKDGLSQNRVRAIVKDRYGFMWFGTWNGLCRYDGYKFKIYKNHPKDLRSIASNRIHYIYKDTSGDLWIETFPSIICRYNYQSDDFTRFKSSQLPKSIRDSTKRQLSLIKIQHLAPELRKTVGLFDLSPTKENIVFNLKPSTEGGLNDNNINCVYKDDDAVLWLGTTTGGVNKIALNPKPFHAYSLANILSSTSTIALRAILTDSADIWVGTQDKGVYCLDRQSLVPKKLLGLQTEKNIRALLKDSEGNIWIGSRTGLDRFSPKSHKTVHYFKDKNSQFTRFFAIAEDPSDKSIWISSTNGILKYNPRNNTFQKQSIPSSLSSSGAGCLFFDSAHHLWIGSEYAGLAKVEREANSLNINRIISYRADGNKPLLLDNRVYSIVQDEKGTIWAGTANGLVSINKNGKIRIFGQNDGLPDTYITKVLTDKRGYIWIGHKLGLSRLSIATGNIRNYTIKENTPNFEFTDASGGMDTKSGELFLGSTEGFVSFLPQQIKDNPKIPTAYFTDITVQNKPVTLGEQVNGRILLQNPISQTKELTFTYDDHSFSIEFAALEYIAPQRIRYAYQLKGIDKEWIMTDAKQRVASYSNLLAGRYQLQVKATNSDGIWSTKPTVLQINILPPWWRTWWAYIYYSMAIALLLYGIFKVIKTRQEYDKSLFEAKLQTEKAIEIDELKSRFFTNISHEFRTPLSLIIDPINALLLGKVSAEKEQNYYQIIHRNASRMLLLINELLEFSKLASGTRKLHIQQQDIVLFIRQLVTSFEYRAEKQQVDLQFITSLDMLIWGFDAEALSKILYNLLSNALKFSPDKSAIIIKLEVISTIQDEVSISVQDAGLGIPANQLTTIFEPFVQVDTFQQSSLEGTGLGLSLTKELVELHQGKIYATSEPFVATIFQFTLKNLAENKALIPVSDSVPQVDLREQSPQQAHSTIVLLVEDNDDIRQYLKSVLENSYQIYEAKNGKEGFEKAQEIIPDLIITDLMMPEENGLVFCQKIKKDERTSHIPVIVLTAKHSQSTEVESYDFGADAFVAKPFDTTVLQSRIQNLLHSRKKLQALFGTSTTFDAQVSGMSEIDQLFINKVNDLIENNLLNASLSVDWLADQLALSRTQLYRKIKALSNQSVHDFISVIRLKKATVYLKEKHTVTETAYLVGYSDATTFSRAFQKQYGQTPKKFGSANQS
ncbi:hybrid sensor histidine kinase/response regulator transcription factor [Arcicella aurantiaca]|nr:hybrid sensor histidine kinase/response regulator transcription factor [Arcicella aurantiaca]